MGELIIGSFENQICLCNWSHKKTRASVDKKIQTSLKAEFIESEDDLIIETKRQINQYFEGARTKFDIPLKFIGSEFQISVWKKLLSIPYGKTCSYLELSRQIDNVKAIRAVGTANSANAISIIVPCHRVIGNNGDLTGYAGGLNTKKKLLELENPARLSQLGLF